MGVSKRDVMMGTLGREGGRALVPFLQSLSPTLLVLYNEPSGDLINYGSDGNSGTVTGATQGQPGIAGVGSYLFDGDDDLITFANADVPATRALTTQRWCFLIKPTGTGEGGLATLFDWDSTNVVDILYFTNDYQRLIAGFDTDGAADPLASTPLAGAPLVTLDAWNWMFMDYDDADVLGLGRKVRLFISYAGSPPALLTLDTDTAGVGTFVAAAENLILGARENGTRTFEGHHALAFASAGLWSPAGAPTDKTLMNRIHALVF